MAEIARRIQRQIISQIFSLKHFFHHICTQFSVLCGAGLWLMCLWWHHVHGPYCTWYRWQLSKEKCGLAPCVGAGVLHQQSCDLTGCLASVNTRTLSDQMTAPPVHHAWCWGIACRCQLGEKTSMMKGLGRETVDI